MAVACALTWNMLRNIPLGSKDTCHEWKKFGNWNASIDHDRMFTHMEDDAFLSNQFTTPIDRLINNPPINVDDIFFEIITSDIIDEMMRGLMNMVR